MKLKYSSIRTISLMVLVSIVTSFRLVGQSGQIDIPRISLMPDMPSPFILRDWKDVAVRYDSLIYSLNATGQYFPLMALKSSGVNYPSLQPILLDSYVGSASHGSQEEAINIIPSVVGATLTGIDKSNQNGINWVLKTKDFFNKANGQNIYLNDPSGASGGDWWYDLMPNVFFYQLYSQYPGTLDFDSQFITVADRWLSALQALGGSTTPWATPNLNYHAFNFASMQPNNSGVPEPESAGSIAWLLYHAFQKTGNKQYLAGARQAMTFLSNQTADPAYEIQLPYGTLVAAKMNATIGTHYDVEKMVNWSFNQSSVRNWGTVVGTWGGSDVSGLVGEINDPNTGYAFSMNGFEQAAALVPMVKYDKRFAKAIAKWTLNLANASRLFYSQYLPPSHQDNYAWSTLYDPHSVIAYEALKQTSSSLINLYGTGDAVRNGWANTNFGLYGSSHIGYLASIITKTDVDGILLLDLNKTDFFAKSVFPSYLLFNPGTTTQVTLPLGAQHYDIYDAISETILYSGASGNYPIQAPGNAVLMLVYIPAGSAPITSNGKLMIGPDVVDYHYGYHYNSSLQLRSFACKDTLVEFNQNEKFYASITGQSGAPLFNWYVNGVLTASTADSTYIWAVPALAGSYKILLSVTAGAATTKDSLTIKVVSHIPLPPIVTGITADSLWYSSGSKATFICNASNLDNSKLQYQWTFSSGTGINSIDSLIQWTSPKADSLYTVTCAVTNLDALTTSISKAILVKKKSQGVTPPFAYYSLDGNTNDDSGNGRNGILQGAQLTADERGMANKAYHFANGSDVIYINNDAGLNFQNQITVSFWVKLDVLTQESYIISHGSYEERWKVSAIVNNKLRWTVKNNTSTKDLDSSFPLALNQFYHVTVVYSGYSMELYMDGVLDNFLADIGPIAISTKEVTFGKKDLSTSSYHLNGTLDEVRIYDKALAPNEIVTLKSLWNTIVTGTESPTKFSVYPNPAHGVIHVSGSGFMNATITDITGRPVGSSITEETNTLYRIDFEHHSGMLIIRIETGTEIVYRKIISD